MFDEKSLVKARVWRKKKKDSVVSYIRISGISRTSGRSEQNGFISNSFAERLNDRRFYPLFFLRHKFCIITKKMYVSQCDKMQNTYGIYWNDVINSSTMWLK